MSPIWRIIKGFVLWSYGRTTWQYDVLCVLILAFIFLTPKSWFANSELNHLQTHQNGSASAQRLLIRPENFAGNPDIKEFERRVRQATGRPEARVSNVREMRDGGGKIVAYEVDIE